MKPNTTNLLVLEFRKYIKIVFDSFQGREELPTSSEIRVFFMKVTIFFQ